MFDRLQSVLSSSLPVNVLLTGTQERLIVRRMLEAMLEPTDSAMAHGARAMNLSPDDRQAPLMARAAYRAVILAALANNEVEG
jgi:hypothetical protein